MNLKKVPMNKMEEGKMYIWAIEPEKDRFTLVRLDENEEGLLQIDNECFWSFDDNLIGEIYGPIELNEV